MIWPAMLCALGIPAGFALILRVPRCRNGVGVSEIPAFSIIIPARNEEKNLPRLLNSIVQSEVRPTEILVVDDVSTDNTAAVASSFGARVLSSAPLPVGWTGKTWACHQGAQHAATNLLFFLDADTYFLPGGLARVLSSWVRARDQTTVLSALPYHATESTYEQLSIIFNLLMAAGAGGFDAFSVKSLFGQSLLVAKDTYFAVGGHQSVRGVVLENLRLAQMFRSNGKHLVSLAGRSTLHMRMFPEGYGQMTESWSKAFVQGAKDSSGLVVAFSIVWISALWSCILLLALSSGDDRTALAVVYLFLGLQLYWQARQIGGYWLITCLLYPIPLAYYCFVFGRSLARKAIGRRSSWKGREV